MTELLRGWLLGIICVSMILAVAEGLVPEGSVKRICRLSGGVVLLIVSVSPFVRLEEYDFGRLAAKYELDAQQYRESLEQEHDFLYESIIAERAEAYISDKAAELGMTCRVSVTVAWEGEYMPKLQAVRITGQWTSEQRERLESIIAEELEIPPALQYFEEQQT